jgi:hypothetical protein
MAVKTCASGSDQVNLDTAVCTQSAYQVRYVYRDTATGRFDHNRKTYRTLALRRQNVHVISVRRVPRRIQDIDNILILRRHQTLRRKRSIS